MSQIKITVMTHTYCDVCRNQDSSPKARVECQTDSPTDRSKVHTVIDICNRCAVFISALTGNK